jgi:trans-aconitate methyltransferase
MTGPHDHDPNPPIIDAINRQWLTDHIRQLAPIIAALSPPSTMDHNTPDNTDGNLAPKANKTDKHKTEIKSTKQNGQNTQRGRGGNGH